MKERRLKIIIAVMSIAVLGLISIQFYWISNLIRVEETRFEKNVGEVLTYVVQKIEENETTELIVESVGLNDDNGIFVFDSAANKSYAFGWKNNWKNKVEFFDENELFFNPRFKL